LYGGSGVDSINGNDQNDEIYGVSGNDTINGEAGNDLIVGGYGADSLNGGTGADVFRYFNTNDTGDTITDFTKADGDKIDFAALYSGTLSFTAGTTTLSAYGAISFFDGATNQTVVQVDTDGNTATAELQIQLTGNIGLVAGDFVL
jgi:Ca2+-binding RTX toxin-like protein